MIEEPPFTFAQLRVALAVAQSGSVTGASKQLHITQPAVSHALAELERRVGSALFERTRRRLALTPEGEILVGKAAELLELASEAAHDMRGAGAGAGGTLRVGASTTVGNYLLPVPLCTFQQRFPRAHVHLTVDITDAIVDGLLAGHFPLAFIEGPCHRAGVSVERFRQDELVMVAAPCNPLASLPEVGWDQASRERFIVRSQGGTREVIDRAIDAGGLKLRPALEFGHTEAIKTAVAQNMGVSILSRLACAQELKAGTLAQVRLVGLQLSRWLYRIALEGRRTSPLASAFLRHLDST